MLNDKSTELHKPNMQIENGKNKKYAEIAEKFNGLPPYYRGLVTGIAMAVDSSNDDMGSKKQTNSLK